MRKIYLFLAVLCLAATTVNGQNVANYGYNTTVTGSLTNMSTGTTTLIAADQDDAASVVTNIGFDFYFQGVRYAQFSVNSNGTLRLGGTAVATTLYNPLAQSGQALITAYGADQRTHITGKVHYRITGTAPNRKLIVEWLNMQADFNGGGAANLTYQVSLSETTGVIEFAYGTMTMSAAGATDVNSSSAQIGFSSGSTAGNVGTVTAAQSGSPAPTYNSGSATPVENSYAAGAIPVLSSAADGVRRTFTFTPPVPVAPTGLSFTAVAATTITVNWTDNAANETAYVIYRATDGINYTYAAQVAANSSNAVLTGLFENTSYQWRVYAVSEGGLSTALSGVQATAAAGTVVSNGTGGGLWSATSTWTGGVIPTINDKVLIAGSDVVTIDVAANAYDVTVGAGSAATLQFEATTARTLTVYNNVTVAAGATFQSATSGTQTGHILTLSGNLVNNGTLDFSTATDAAGAAITFTGNNDNSFGGSGTITDIRQLNINKGTTTAILELNPASFSVRGSVTDVVTGGFLALNNGTFKISGTFTYTGRMFGATAYAIPVTSTVWLNNPNFTIAAQAGNVVNNGILRISNGTWNMGTTNAHTVTAGAGALFNIEGGTINISGRFNPSTAITYTQSGGVVNLATVGNSGSGTTNGTFTLTSTAVFNMSGGNINLVQASTGTTPIDWIVSSSTFNYTGGTLTLGTAATATNFNFRIRGNVPGLVIDNTTNNKTATLVSQTNLQGATTINSGATLVINGQVCLVIGSPFTNNGTLTGTVASTRFYFLTGSGPITYTGTGIVTAPLLAFEVDNTAGVIIDPSVNQIVTLRVNNFAGGITNANKLTVGNGGSTTGTVQLGVNGVTSPVGGFDVPPVFNPGSGGAVVVYAPELTARTTGNEMPPSRTLSALSVLNTNGVTINGGDVTTSTLNLSANVTTGSNTLTLGTSPTATGTYNYTAGTIVGRFKRWIGTTATNFDFPVGIATAKRNASINFTAAPTTGGSLTTQWVSSPGGNNGLPLTEGAITITNTSNDGYWRVVSGDGLAGGTYTGTFTATGIADVTDVTQLVLTKRANTAAPWVFDGTHVTTTGTVAAPVLSRTGMTGFSEFGIGGTFAVILPVNLLSFSGEQTGDVNQLYWTTASEQNNQGFEVQRSNNGTDYTVLGFVNSRAANGNSGINLDYSYTDRNPAGATQYYRLRQVDRDGRSKYSNVIQIKGKQAAKLNISSVYPNPARNEITLSVTSPVRSTVTVSIINMNGQTMGQQTVAIGTGSNSLPVNISNLPAGYYMFKLTSEQGSAVTRFVKQ